MLRDFIGSEINILAVALLAVAIGFDADDIISNADASPSGFPVYLAPVESARYSLLRLKANLQS